MYASASASHAPAAHECLTQRPRRCGPLLTPGETAPGLRIVKGASKHSKHGLGLNVSDAQANVLMATSLLWIPANGTSDEGVLVCAPAKVGSTSFHLWLFEALTGQPYTYKDQPWVHDTSSHRWRDALRPGQGVPKPFAKLAANTQRRILRSASVLRVALVRHPLERMVSAYYSKTACSAHIHDANDHRVAVTQLMAQAPTAAEELRILLPKENKHGPALRRVRSVRGQWVPCLSPSQWTTLLAEAHKNVPPHVLNVHFTPQVDACGFRSLGYHLLLPLGSHQDGLAQIASFVGAQKVPALRRAHALWDKEALGDQEMQRLAATYQADIRALGY